VNANTTTRFGSAVRTVDPRAPGLTLGDALAYFVRRPSAQLLALLFSSTLAARIALGEFSLWDLAVAAGVVAVQPLTEWLIHVEILHFRPRLWRGRVVDIPIAHDHRAHHADPHDPTWWFIPAPSMLTGFAFLLGLAWLLMPTVELALTMSAAVVALGTVYEWTHFLCHSSWRPRSAWYRQLWKLHRLHHFKNENYWMGVTMHAADRVLGTLPEAGDVDTSPTCRNLDRR
jgi:fatty acid hydroxylase family protein